MKPKDYRASCIVAQDTKYKVPVGQLKGSNAGDGILNRGRVVWIRNKLSDCEGRATVSAYADGIGVFEIDPKRLIGTH